MDAYIYDVVRTARGAAHEKGGLAQVTPLELLTQTAAGLKARQEQILPAELIVGCVTQTNEQGGHIARMAALMAGLGNNVSAMMVNNFCCSGLDACQTAAFKTSVSHQMIFAGGVESMSRVAAFSDAGPYYTAPDVMQAASFSPLWISADFVATAHGISRADADAYAAASQKKAADALARGNSSIIPLKTPTGIFDADENVRPKTTAEKLAGFETLFDKFGPKTLDAAFLTKYTEIDDVSHIHHVGSAPCLADAAALLLIGSETAGIKNGVQPRARIRAVANIAADPMLSLTGGIEAAKLVLDRAGMDADAIDLFEFNEAYAAVCLLFARELDIDADRLNVNGGAIALGHPMGATGAILIGSLLEELERRGQTTGLVALSGAAGLGSAMIIERV